jgi:osmotically-inducible protein OsmY
MISTTEKSNFSRIPFTPKSRPIHDSSRRVQIEKKFYPTPGRHPIHITVKNGNVILEGAVGTTGQKTIAGIQANSTAGVFSLTNDLVVLSEVEQ